MCDHCKLSTSNDPAVRPGCCKMALNLALASSWSRLPLLEPLQAEPCQTFAPGQWAKVVLFEGGTTRAMAASVSATLRKMSEECGARVKCWVAFGYLDLRSHAHSHDRIIRHGRNNQDFCFGKFWHRQCPSIFCCTGPSRSSENSSGSCKPTKLGSGLAAVEGASGCGWQYCTMQSLFF